MIQREIRFRGLSEDGWVYGYYVKHGSAATIESPAGDRHNLVHVVKPETVGQYAGLKDKNGVDVYEGDVVLLPANQRCEIKYINTAFVAVAISPPENHPKDYHFWSAKEVIGNIHEGVKK